MKDRQNRCRKIKYKLEKVGKKTYLQDIFTKNANVWNTNSAVIQSAMLWQSHASQCDGMSICFTKSPTDIYSETHRLDFSWLSQFQPTVQSVTGYIISY